MIPETMRAVVLTGPTKAEDVKLTDFPVPEVRPGWVLVKVKAFGMNHSESILRLGEIRSNAIPKPIIPGIECVGEIADPSDSPFETGQRVAAFMGGMGRSFHGSYAQYALLPSDHVFKISSGLTWTQLAAVPETYFTAWGSLFQCLDLKPEDVLLIRGGTCALGYAALQLAKALGCRVIATTHKKEKLPLLAEADQAILDRGSLAGSRCLAAAGESVGTVTKALELVGPRTLCDTLNCVRPGGIVCSTGILGGVFGLNGFDPIKDIPNGVYLTGFYSNWPSKSEVEEILRFLEEQELSPCVGACFDFAQIREACIALDQGTVNGKIVVNVSVEA